MEAQKLRPRQLRPGPRLVGGYADYEMEEIDEVESLPREIEHDEDERDPDPERYGAPSDHAQEKRHVRKPAARRNNPHPR